ncbi:MAG: hypothetical protein GC191_09475 [Azospirillum sp.]|nr:hypothetical protein [Azospirillum sp.]
MSYVPKNYQDQGGDRTVIGGVLQVAAGGSIVGADGSQAAAIADVPTAGAALAAANATAINAILAVLRATGQIAAT